MVKKCKWCKKEKPVEEFCKDISRPRGYSTECKECSNARGRIYYKANKQFWRERYLKRKYNLTQEDFNKLVKEQNNRCAICEEELPLVVDHDHLTGKIRGLLCNDCNLGIGFFNDDPKMILEAVKYLDAR